jgi:hypothetical protein
MSDFIDSGERIEEASGQDRPPTVIVAGAQGVSGNAVLRQYAELSGAKVYGLSRRRREFET